VGGDITILGVIGTFADLEARTEPANTTRHRRPINQQDYSISCSANKIESLIPVFENEINIRFQKLLTN
jgi:hypothetical protein